MKKYLSLIVIALFFMNCNAQKAPTQFSEKALQDTFTSLKGEDVTFQSILDAHKGKTIVVEIWASWCSDCIKGMPKLKELQAKKDDVVYLFLSLDKSTDSWKRGIKKYDVKGEHYFMQSGWKGDFGTFVNLDWIPRYMVVGADGSIKHFKAIAADDKQLINALK